MLTFPMKWDENARVTAASKTFPGAPGRVHSSCHKPWWPARHGAAPTLNRAVPSSPLDLESQHFQIETRKTWKIDTLQQTTEKRQLEVCQGIECRKWTRNILCDASMPRSWISATKTWEGNKQKACPRCTQAEQSRLRCFQVGHVYSCLLGGNAPIW